MSKLLSQKNLSPTEMMRHTAYKIGDRLHVTKAEMKRHGISEKKNEFTVTSKDPEKNVIQIQGHSGKVYEIQLNRINPSQIAVYHETERSFAVGDRLVALKNDRSIGVKNGELFWVKSIDPEKNTITLQNDRKTVQIDLTRYNYLDHGYATTVHKSQGMTVSRVLYDASGKVSYNLAYVALTRGKHDYQVYISYQPGKSEEKAIENAKVEFYSGLQKENSKLTTHDLTQGKVFVSEQKPLTKEEIQEIIREVKSTKHEERETHTEHKDRTHDHDHQHDHDQKQEKEIEAGMER